MGILSFFKRDTDMNSPKMIRLLISEKLATRRDGIELMQGSIDAESFFYGYNVWLKAESEIYDTLIVIIIKCIINLLRCNTNRHWHITTCQTF